MTTNMRRSMGTLPTMCTGEIVETGEIADCEVTKKTGKLQTEFDYITGIKWDYLIYLIFIHVGFLYGFFLLFTQAKLFAFPWVFFMIITSIIGTTAGAHRLWSHRSYKAIWPLRLLLILLFTGAGQRSVYTWVLDHRLHHKFTDTDADPHNSKRGFFFAHCLWIVRNPHPELLAKKETIDTSDLDTDPMIMCQTRYYIPLFMLMGVGVPMMVPWYFWDESMWVSFWVNVNLRLCVTLNLAFSGNSISHMWGQKPYDKHISPVENFIFSILTLGEGWHNFHHVFPGDYKSGELDYSFNITTRIIDSFARIGWVYDRKSVSSDMVKRRANRSGDGSYIWDSANWDVSKEDNTKLDHMLDTQSFQCREI